MKIPMPTCIAEIYDELRSEVTWLHGRWICYRQLYATSPKRIDLLNESASTFFYIIEDVLLSDVQISLCKLTDPAESGKYKNFSLKQLQARLDEGADQSLSADCKALLKVLSTQCSLFRTRRHKKLAHLDLAVALRTPPYPLPGVSRDMIENALDTVRRFLNAIERHYNGNEFGYEHFNMNGDGEALIATLRSGLRYEELLQERRLPHDDWRQGKWHGV